MSSLVLKRFLDIWPSDTAFYTMTNFVGRLPKKSFEKILRILNSKVPSTKVTMLYFRVRLDHFSLWIKQSHVFLMLKFIYKKALQNVRGLWVFVKQGTYFNTLSTCSSHLFMIIDCVPSSYCFSDFQQYAIKTAPRALIYWVGGRSTNTKSLVDLCIWPCDTNQDPFCSDQ